MAVAQNQRKNGEKAMAMRTVKPTEEPREAHTDLVCNYMVESMLAYGLMEMDGLTSCLYGFLRSSPKVLLVNSSQLRSARRWC